MSMATAKRLEDIIQESPYLREEIEDFANFVWEKHASESKSQGLKPLGFSWAGGLKELRDQYTSVELQHKIKETWEENVSDGLQHPSGATSGKGKGR